ncbi:spindle pole body component 110-like [Nicotiana sylvestris]|uniref:spindle pole body component 110-like n=1 Tax=Nicotiana sylvestris TaxID=4096 RepID=UPI00388CC6D9
MNPHNRALGEELEKGDQELMQMIRSKSELEEQLRVKDEELELGKGVAAECEYLQGKLRSMQSEMDQNLVQVKKMRAEWRGKLTAMESKVAGLESTERAWSEALARAAALDDTIRVLQSEQESERATTTLMKARLEERISMIDQEASVLGDRVMALEAKNERLKAQIESSPASIPHQVHEIWVYAKALRDIYKSLWEAGTVAEASYKEAQAKAREARINFGYNVATNEANRGADGDDDEPCRDGDDDGGDDVE